MSMKETPLAAMKRLYGSKDKLVEKLAKELAETGAAVDESAEELKTRLLAASNQKLLRLAEITSAVKEKYGNKDKLVAAVSTAVGKAKDSDFVAKLQSYSVPKLWDMVKSAERRNR